MMSSTLSNHIDAADLSERLVGISPVYLQNFVQRSSFGIRASVEPGRVRSQRRRFSRDDVFGIALVWLLFEAGLRNDPMSRTLRNITKTKAADANLAAKKLLTAEVEYLVLAREPRGPSKALPEMPEQRTKIVKKDEALRLLSETVGACEIFIPVGHKFRDIAARMELLFSE